MHHSSTSIIHRFSHDPENEGLPDTKGHPAVVVVKLAEGESSWNPASTKPERSVYGPATVTYRKYRDGAIEATVS